MSLTDHQIDEIAQANLPEGQEFDSRELYTDPDGILYQISWIDGRLGGHRLFIVRRTGNAIQLFCEQIDNVKYWVEFYEDGGTTGRYVVTIQDVRRKRRLATLFVRSKLSYTFLEQAHDVVWQTTKRYTKRLIRRRLQHLPSVFHDPGQTLRDILPKLGRLATFEYSIDLERQYSWHPEDYGEGELGPQW